MKATIRRPDGTTIEAEGTAEEIERLAGAPAQHTPPAPLFVPGLTEPGPQRWPPRYMRDPLRWGDPRDPPWGTPFEYGPYAPTVTSDRIVLDDGHRSTCGLTAGPVTSASFVADPAVPSTRTN